MCKTGSLKVTRSPATHKLLYGRVATEITEVSESKNIRKDKKSNQ
jgi:hypothetical protein